jgi:DNA repair protein RecO (recombination protein O)
MSGGPPSVKPVSLIDVAATSRLYRTDAIVLSRFELGEADRVVTLLTPHFGKLKAIARGVRKPSSRLGGGLEPFAELHLLLARGRTFDVVTQVSVEHAWLNLRERLGPTAVAWYVAELADRAIEERHEAIAIYGLLRRAYALLDAGMEAGRVARWFEMRLADELGIQPELERCVECDRPLEPDEQFLWVPALGGIVCSRHAEPPAERMRLSTGALKLLRAYRRADAEALAALRLPASVEAEVESAMRIHLRHHLDREPRSRAFLDELGAAARPA